MDAFYGDGTPVCERDRVTLKSDHSASGRVLDADPEDGAVWVEFLGQERRDDWFDPEDLILVWRQQ